MSQKPLVAGKLRRYLLGALSEDETAELEGLYFASDELFEELLAEEDDLVDAYVSGELTPDEMSRFDALLSGSARLRRRVETARAVRLRKAPLRRTLPVRALLLAATVILALGVSWAVRKARPSGEIATTAPPGPISTAPAAISTPPILATGSARNVFSCVLAAGLTRGTSEAATLAIPKGTETVELRLLLEADAFSSYDVDLRTEAGAAVLEQHGLRSRKEKAKTVLVVEVPATNLPQGTYVLTLSGIAGRGATETLDQYRFRVPAR